MSSSDIAVSVRGLSKSYTIAHNAVQHTTAAEALVHRLKNPFHRSERETFWALKDLDFDIQKGDVVGIIGRNGAGKSTLLKILSRITEPTTGNAILKGRVGSLLEVGTGFHPELTGRENIYLNGAILGMSKREITREFDAIVDFAGSEQFLDTPVKRYSSGMYVRLAFAVAAHLNPEILIVDEVLAVGDSEFQKKCLGKMQDVAKSGRTVLFVSHNMAAVNNLCQSCLILKNGFIAFQGKTQDATKFYLNIDSIKDIESNTNINIFRPSWAKPLINSVRMIDKNGNASKCFPLGSDITFEMTFASPIERLRVPVMGVVINHATFGIVGGVNSRMTNFQVKGESYSQATMTCVIKNFPFLQGQYNADIWLGDGMADLDVLIGSVSFDIEDADIYGSGKTPFSYMGVTLLIPEWQITEQISPSGNTIRKQISA